ncbi:MAG TPA: hemerythrin domain-containing protein [Holophagaceae bacterium]|nr:hemerythrin domain-containing protein [Holophagaceae bacterium]
MDSAVIHDEHRTILGRVRDLSEDLEGFEVEKRADQFAWKVRDLGLKLKQHFQGERNSLYGRLLREGDAVTRSLTQICITEAKAAEEELDGYLRQWMVPLHIQRDPEGFRMATRTLLRCVGRRTGREERELLPRLKELEARAQAHPGSVYA